MTITLVTPIALEQLVPVTTGILFDTTEAIISVTVNALLVWNGTPQNGWSGFTIVHAGGTRYVLDPPAVFNMGDNLAVVVTGSPTVVSYSFAIGLRQITTSDDASVPRISEGGPPNPPAVTPTWFLKLDDAAGPPVDEQAAYTFTQTGSPTWQQTGIIPAALKAVQLNGGGDALITRTTDVIVQVNERLITVDNVSGGAVTNASVAVVVDTAALIAGGKMAADSGAEFRTNGGTPVPYWMEGPAASAATTYWFKVASLPTGVSTFRMRFSPASVFPTENDKYNAFLFFDDFSSGAIDPGRWTVTGSGFSIVGGKLRGGVAHGGNNYMRSVITFPVSTPTKVVARISETAAAVNGFTTLGLFNGTSDNTSILSHNGTSYYYANGGFTNFNFDGLGVDVVDEAWMTGAQVRFRRVKSSQTYDSGLIGATLNGETIFLGARGDFYNPGAQAYACAWSVIYARAYMATEPTITFGADTSIGTVAMPVNPDPLKLSKFSLSGWFNPSSVSAQRALASSGRSSLKGWVLRALATNLIEFRIFNGVTSTAATSTTIAATNVWHHVVVVVDLAAGVLRLYVDSNKEVDIAPTTSSAVYETLVDFFLGQDPVAAPDQFQGRLDQWKYFPGIVLTDGQVSLLFQESTGPLRTPWIGYSREPGNIYVRKDEPLTDEVFLVPGNKVDIGYDEVRNEIEIMYIHNGKVFLVTGQPSETPSTLTQPSILKTNFKTGDVGTWDDSTFAKADFPPVKLAAPPDGPMVTGDVGTWEFSTYALPPSSAPAVALLGPPVAVIIGPAPSTLITAVHLFKSHFGAVTLLAEFTYSLNLSVYLDYAYVDGDTYLTKSVYGDPGAPARQRLTDPSASAAAGPGDVYATGDVGTWDDGTYTTANFPPLKLAVPTDGPYVTGDVGDHGDHAYSRNWFPPNAAAASMGASLDGYLVISGLGSIGRQHLGLTVDISGASNAANNGSWTIVEVISASSVRVRAVGAAGGDANNGALTWTVGGALSVSPASFVTKNTSNIGVG